MGDANIGLLAAACSEPDAERNMTGLMTQGRDLLRIEDLHVSFPLFRGRIDAVRGAALRVQPGRITALVGESGSGKSVISRAVMGLLPEFVDVSGQIRFDDAEGTAVDMLRLPADGREIRAIRGRRIGMIFQEPMTSLSPLHTVGNQITESLRIHTPLTRAERRERCEHMLQRVGFTDPDRVFDMYPFELSGGMRQRAMIAMALICRPALLVADEPTTALDVTIQAQILVLLRELQAEMGMAMLLITHDLGVVANIADEVVVLYRGQVMESGPVADIFRRPAHPYLKGLIGALPDLGRPREVRLQPLREIGIGHIRELAAICGVPPSTAKRSDVLLTVRNVGKSFPTRQGAFLSASAAPGAVPAVADVSFDIRRGECLGLVGESGSGKTTLSKILMRGLTPDCGSVILEDAAAPIDVLAAEGPALRRLRTKMQMIFQDPVASLSPRMPVGRIIAEPLEIHRRGDAASRRDVVAALLHAVGLGRGASMRYPHSFSGGQRQRIGIARALALAPELIICDEPVSALDVSVQAQVLNLLKDLQRELHLTYLFISHNLAVVGYMADRIAVMWRGRLVELAPSQTLMSRPVHPYTRALLAAVPLPDLDRPLDFAEAGRSSTLAAASWPPQFREDGGSSDMGLVDLGAGHFVRARITADAREVAS
jgi:peptide/nickel transport system ATP-binding protein